MVDPAAWRELEDELRAVGRRIDVPPPTDVPGGVRRRLEAAEGRAARSGVLAVRVRPLGWSALRVATVVVLVLLGLIVVTPQGRAMLADVFRFAGVELRQDPGAAASPGTSGSLPGERRMSLAHARRHVTFPILVPAKLGAPDEVVVSDGGRVASLVYHGTRYGEVRLDEFDGHLDPVYFKKFVHSRDVTQVRVDDRKALWIKGRHELMYVRRDGNPDTASARLTTGNTLVWDTGKVALRLEGNLDEAQAVGIADSAR